MTSIIRNIKDNPVEVNGYFNKYNDSVIAFSDITRKLTLTPLSTEYIVYIEDEKYIIDTVKEVTIPDTEGIHIIYMALSLGIPQLFSTQIFFDDIINKYALTSVIYWDSENNTAIYIGEERHGLNMSRDTHFYLHGSRGTQIRAYPEIGLGLDDFVINGDGSLNSHAQFSINNGEIFDEDLDIFIEDDSPQNLSPILHASIYYRDGVNGYWRKDSSNAFPVKRFGSGRLAYNEWTGTTWQQTEVSNNSFMIQLVIATGDRSEPIKIVQGTEEYTTIGKAKAGAFEEAKAYLLRDSFAIEEVLIGMVFYQTNDSYTNTVKAKTVSVDNDNYIDLRNSDKKDITSPVVNVLNNITIVGGLTFGDSLNPPQITVDQLVYAPLGLFDHILIRVESSTSVRIHGLPQPDPVEVRVLEFKNYGTKNITFLNNSGSVNSENRFDFDTNKVLGPKGGLTVRYDDVDLKWFLTGAVL